MQGLWPIWSEWRRSCTSSHPQGLPPLRPRSNRRRLWIALSSQFGARMRKNSGSAAYKRCQVIARNVSGQSRRTETSVAQDAVVLIVDDDEMVRRCLVRLIRAKGSMAQAYASAEEFLSAKPIDDSVC